MRKAALLVAMMFAAVVVAQDKPVVLTPNGEQLTRLQLKQKDAVIAQKDAQLAQVAFNQAQQIYQSAVTALDVEAEKVKSENKWDAKSSFDRGSLVFTAPVAPPAPTPAVKK